MNSAIARKIFSPPYLRHLAAILPVLVFGCGPVGDPPMQLGGLYSVEDGTGGYRIAKLLLYDTTVAHLCLYSNRFTVRPDTISISILRLQPREGELAGREHFPAARYLFRAWNPELIGFDSVTDAERDLVQEWSRLGGKVVGR